MIHSKQREINAESFYVVEGSVISNGKLLESDRGYIAEPHTCEFGLSRQSSIGDQRRLLRLMTVCN
jgi:hypothetical protein